MTSGEFTSVFLDSILIKREERQRREIREIDDLALSIKNRGLIHPPVITRDHVLVAGERRVAACKLLGWTHIPIQWVDELSPRQLKAIEHEENVKRMDIDWQDKVKSIEELHNLNLEEDPNWSQQKTADEIGYGRQMITNYLELAAELKSGNKALVDALGRDPKLKLSKALNVIENDRSRKKAADDERFKDSLRPADAPPRAESILQTSFLEWAPAYRGPRFNLLHVDFPYGIGADSFNQGSAPSHGGYDDTPDTYRALCNCLITNLERFCDDSAHILFWFSMEYYNETLELLRTQFEVGSFPLIWFKSDNIGILPDPRRGPRRVYETAFFGSRGDRAVVRPVSNLYAAPSVRDSHMSEKSEPMLRYFFGMIVDQYTSLLDPTCGSGSALRAAESLNAKSVLGLEINSEFAERAKLKLAQARTLRELAP